MLWKSWCVNTDCSLETRKEVEIVKELLKILPLLHTPHPKKGRMTENENYYEQTVGNPVLKGFTVPV